MMEKFGLEVYPRGDIVEVFVETTDPRRQEVDRQLNHRQRYKVLPSYIPVFEPWEVEQARLLRLIVHGLCGRAFVDWATDTGLPVETRVMDKREMKSQDIASTYRAEVIVSERLRWILVEEALTGWDAQPIQHIGPEKDSYYHLTATNELPPLAPETDLHVEEHPDPSDNLFGTVGFFQHSPLYYRRGDLVKIEDFNRTREKFGEAPVAQPYLILSQRAWQVFQKRGIVGVRRDDTAEGGTVGVDVEPIVILD